MRSSFRTTSAKLTDLFKLSSSSAARPRRPRRDRPSTDPNTQDTSLESAKSVKTFAPTRFESLFSFKLKTIKKKNDSSPETQFAPKFHGLSPEQYQSSSREALYEWISKKSKKKIRFFKIFLLLFLFLTNASSLKREIEAWSGILSSTNTSS